MILRRNFRKYVMLLFKLFVACFPLFVKKWFRKSPYLTSLYSRNLQKSGLFYGFPSRKKLEVLYNVNCKQQDVQLAHFMNASAKAHNFLVVVAKGRSKGLKDTIESLLLHANLDKVWLMCAEDELSKCEAISADFKDKVVSLSIATASSKLEELVGSAFLLFAGDIIHSKLTSVFESMDVENIDCFYCDTDQIENKKRESPLFLPDWNPDLQLSTAYVQTALWVKDIRKIREISCPPRSEFIASFLVYLWSKVEGELKIYHSPFVLIHSTITTEFSFKNYAKNISQHLDKSIEIKSSEAQQKLSLTWPTAGQPLVSLVIPTKNGLELVKACIDSILQKTTYENYEILLVDNNSDDPDAIQYFQELNKHPKIRLLDYPFEFNYSAINNFAVSNAQGSVIGLVNNDIEVISPNWLSVMLGQVIRPDIGCVGAKLLYSDGRIQHAGVVLGYGGGAGHAHKYFPQYHPGYMNRLGASGNYSAVTAACLLVKKEDYLAVKGLDEVAFKIAFNDVDFCLKVLGLGKRNLYCAEAELFHHESVSRGFEDTDAKRARFDSELSALKENWDDYIQCDPAYNPNLTLSRENFSIKEQSKSQ